MDWLGFSLYGEQLHNDEGWAHYPRSKVCVFCHERWQNDDGFYSNLRVNSTPASLNAYREGVADSFFLSRPLFE